MEIIVAIIGIIIVCGIGIWDLYKQMCSKKEIKENLIWKDKYNALKNQIEYYETLYTNELRNRVLKLYQYHELEQIIVDHGNEKLIVEYLDHKLAKELEQDYK